MTDNKVEEGEATARELLALEYENESRPIRAEELRRSGPQDDDDKRAVRAIEAALSAPKPVEGGKLRGAMDEARGLIQEAKGIAGPGSITDHLDSAEHWLDKIEKALPLIQPRPDGDLREALTKCRDQFAFYAREHSAAGKHEKAATNQSFADLADAALSVRQIEREG